jgi:ParB family transcriptional regulator, chromosome partitioning protein
MSANIALSLIDENPYNSRKAYDRRDVLNLVDSLKEIGLMSPVKVRSTGKRYQLVFGHRRVRAARMLKWETIRGEVVDLSDESMLKCSLIENMERRNLSDFEIAISFRRMNREFGKTYGEIGKMVGYSAPHVCNFVRMVEMFDDHEDVTREPSLFADLQRITEHHARILLRVNNSETRRQLLQLVVAEDLSVRDLQRIVQRFRSWFNSDLKERIELSLLEPTSRKISEARDEIVRCLIAKEKLPHIGDFLTFQRMHAFERGFSLYSNVPPFERLEGNQALEYEKKWFFSLDPSINLKVRDVKIQFFSDVALATLSVDRTNRTGRVLGSVRGSVLFANFEGRWMVVHEHWSNSLTETNQSLMAVAK